MTTKELIFLVREVIDSVDNGNEHTINDLVQPLRDVGITPNVHEGRGKEMVNTDVGQRMMVEWYAGQLLSIVDNKAWHCVNSIVNTKNKFAPLPSEDEE